MPIGTGLCASDRIVFFPQKRLAVLTGVQSVTGVFFFFFFLRKKLIEEEAYCSDSQCCDSLLNGANNHCVHLTLHKERSEWKIVVQRSSCPLLFKHKHLFYGFLFSPKMFRAVTSLVTLLGHSRLWYQIGYVTCPYITLCFSVPELCIGTLCSALTMLWGEINIFFLSESFWCGFPELFSIGCAKVLNKNKSHLTVLSTPGNYAQRKKTRFYIAINPWQNTQELLSIRRRLLVEYHTLEHSRYSCYKSI